jgi:hypothetical protein
MNPTVAALSRLIAINEIAAAFVFNRNCEILAREIDARYKDEGLQQIAKQLIAISTKHGTVGSPLRDMRIGFENFSVWLRVFSPNSNYFLVVFLQLGADPSLLRQPINLAVLNLEKAVQNIEELLEQSTIQSDIYQAAQAAERQLFALQGEDTNGFYASLSRLGTFYFGPTSEEILQFSCRELELSLPLTTIEDMKKAVERCAERIPEAGRKKSYLAEAFDLVERLYLRAQTRRPKG